MASPFAHPLEAGELDLGSAARYAEVSLYEMMAELHRRGIETTTFEQVVDGLETLVEGFGEDNEVTRRAIAELRRIAGE